MFFFYEFRCFRFSFWFRLKQSTFILTKHSTFLLLLSNKPCSGRVTTPSSDSSWLWFLVVKKDDSADSSHQTAPRTILEHAFEAPQYYWFGFGFGFRFRNELIGFLEQVRMQLVLSTRIVNWSRQCLFSSTLLSRSTDTIINLYFLYHVVSGITFRHDSLSFLFLPSIPP